MKYSRPLYSIDNLILDSNTKSYNYISQRKHRPLLATFTHSDGAGGTTTSDMVFIPRFPTGGWPQAASNGLEVGGFWVDAYKIHPDATSTARGTAALIPRVQYHQRQERAFLYGMISHGQAHG